MPVVAPILGDVGQPHTVWRVGGEVALHHIVMDGRSDLAAIATLREHRPHLVLAAQPIHPVLADSVAGVRQDVFTLSAGVSAVVSPTVAR